MLKKIIFLISVILLMGMLILNIIPVSTFAQGGGIYAGVEPLEAPTELKIGQLIGTNLGFALWLVGHFGGYEQVGITPDYVVFNNGPVMVEALASNSWDYGSFGLGGTLTGIIGHDAIIIAAPAYDKGSLKFFAYPDDPIVKAGKNIPESPLLYGTQETWKGREIYMPTGTTLHYVLGVALGKFGLTDADVNLIHMNVASGNTAFRAGKGGIVGLWGNFTYASDMDEKFIPIIQAGDVGIDIMLALVANPNSYEDSLKTKAIKKSMELYFITANWILNNMDESAVLFKEWCDSVGAKSTVEECLVYLQNDPPITLEENYRLATTYVEEDGKKMSLLEAINYRPLSFFVSKGNYEPQSLDKLLAGNFDTKYIKELYEESKK